MAKKGNRNNKKLQEEIDEYSNEIPQDFKLIEMEYDYCKYSFTGLDDYIDTSGSVVSISDRDINKKLWSVVGYVSSITQKKSKKSGNKYTLLTLTDFRDTISVFVFGDEMRKELEEKTGSGTLVKAVIKNDGGWLKLPWPKEIGGQFPVKPLR
jgi:DNA polymerase III alpha subunit